MRNRTQGVAAARRFAGGLLPAARRDWDAAVWAEAHEVCGAVHWEGRAHRATIVPPSPAKYGPDQAAHNVHDRGGARSPPTAE